MRVKPGDDIETVETGKGDTVGWVVHCSDCGIPIHVLMKIKAKYIKDEKGEVIGWIVPCRDCGMKVKFYKPSKKSKFVPTAAARCEGCYEDFCERKLRE